jgi:glutaryl-CoA dehydrogenase
MPHTDRPAPAADPLELICGPDLLTAEETAVRDTVRRFADEQLRPHLADWFERGHFPRELVPEFGRLGLLGMQLEGYGCAGVNTVSYGLACMEMEAADAALRSFLSVQGSLAMFAIWKFGTEEQKQQWLPKMAAGAAIGCYGLTEPDFGSNPGGMRTNAKKDGTDWILNGSKMWITSGSIADVAVVWARTDEGVRGFLVPKGTPGFTATDIKQKLSMRISVTSSLAFDDVRLPADALLPEARGLRAPLSCLDEARLGIVFGCLGAARECLTTAIDYAATREVFDKPLGGYQLTQQKLADMSLELSKGYLLALRLGRLKESGQLTALQISAGKLNNVRESMEIARTSRTILGANGITLDYPVLRHANNMESVLTYEGTTEVHTLVLGQALTGQDAFR